MLRAYCHISSSKQSKKKKYFYNLKIRLKITVIITSDCYINTGGVIRAHRFFNDILQVLKHKAGLQQAL